jgi:hypothetical protein
VLRCELLYDRVDGRVHDRAIKDEDDGAVGHVHVARPVVRLELAALEEEAHVSWLEADVAAHDSLGLGELCAFVHVDLLDKALSDGKLEE